MNTQDAAKDFLQKPGPAHYLLLGLASLGVIWLVLFGRNLGTFALLPVLVGLLGLAFSWRMALSLMLLILAAFIQLRPYYFHGSFMLVSDLVLCCAVLGYAMALYRLTSLRAFIFPPDPRKKEGPARWRLTFLGLRYQAEQVRQARSAALVSTKEIGMLLMSLPIWALLAQIIWNSLKPGWSNPGFPSALWRAILLTWLAGIFLFCVATFFGYWSRRKMTPEEAAMFLQDTLWKETRTEQRSINRWLAWARLRNMRKVLR